MLIVIFIVLVFIFAGGFFAYKIWGDQIMEKVVAGKPGNAKERLDVGNLTTKYQYAAALRGFP